jgi:cation:H+ antiporter
MIINISVFLMGLFLLIFGANILIQSSAKLALLLKLTPLFIGLTIIAIGTSAPESAVGIVATIKKSQGIALGTIIGSNIANIGLVLGISGLIKPLRISKRLFKIELPFFLLSSFFLFLFCFDLEISSLEGAFLLFFLFIFYLLTYISSKKEPEIANELVNMKFIKFFKKINSKILLFFSCIISLVLVVEGANLMVKSGINLAHILGISTWIIGITVFAIGTSLPELATSLSAIFKKVPSISIGNVIGSNIFNILFVLGLISVIRPISLQKSNLKFEIPAMLFFTMLVSLFMKTKKTLSRKESFILLLSYILFLILLF